MALTTTPTATHWGNYLVRTEDSKIVAVDAYPEDQKPSPIKDSLRDTHHRCRISAPMIRKGYLEKGWRSEGGGRGKEPFVQVSWERAWALAAEALNRTRDKFGNEAIYGGSYGWSSAGRFHHAQSQVHRFLNCFGGYTNHVNTYSLGAGRVILPHVFGTQALRAGAQAPTCDEIAAHTKLVVAFGGIATKNMQVNAGGLGNHHAEHDLQAVRAAGVRYINVSPVRDDTAAYLDATWWPVRPASDVALMLALCHVLMVEGLVDTDFVTKYCVGWAEFSAYVLGSNDGRPKDPDWAAEKCEIPASQIHQLARQMAAEQTLISISWSLQRSEHGEQTWWTGLALAALLGHIGRPGGGITFGYGSVHAIGFYGRRPRPFKLGSLPQGKNDVTSFIPVARIADMLLSPGEKFPYNGANYRYPDIKLIYWAGGNPFHHHQDINKLRRAWAKPETIIVNESVWNPLSRHADIVFPATMVLERNDFGGGDMDVYLTPMPKALEPYGEAKDDYDIFAGLAQCLNINEAFTEGKSSSQWLEELYETTREQAAAKNIQLPEFASFWRGQQLNVAENAEEIEFDAEKFRADPERYPLQETVSGKIELYSEKIAGYHYDDCGGHPAWYDKVEWLGSERTAEFPLHLISSQPRTRLHSQFDFGVTSVRAKINGREAVRINPTDAAARGIAEGDVVRLFNDRGACLAGVHISDAIRPSVVELPTGAWYDPQHPEQENSLCVHGNANVLTRDVGSSSLAQGTTAHSCLVEIELYTDELPPIRAFDPPEILT